MSVICYYHRNCFDGMAAAWVVNRKFPDARLIPVQYGDAELMRTIVQDCYENANINDDYVVVDFSFPRDLMELMWSKAKTMIVLDHHKSAEENCKGLPFCVFDMEKSGAGLAWDYFFNPQLRPRLVDYVEDRDLWRFALSHSKQINAFIQSFEMNVWNYEQVNTMLSTEAGFAAALTAGEAIERYKKSMVDTICSNAVIKHIAGYHVPVVNATLLFSEIGHELCRRHVTSPFAASYFIRNDGKIQYSLRSIGEFDVSDVAKLFGGGGYRNAAGFESYIAVDVEARTHA